MRPNVSEIVGKEYGPQPGDDSTKRPSGQQAAARPGSLRDKPQGHGDHRPGGSPGAADVSHVHDNQAEPQNDEQDVGEMVADEWEDRRPGDDDANRPKGRAQLPTATGDDAASTHRVPAMPQGRPPSARRAPRSS